MEGMERLSLTEDNLNDDPVLSYTLAQLRHDEVTQALLANPPSEGVDRSILSCWHRNEMFHINVIYYAGLESHA
jgi:hypothetical protein